MKTLYRIILFSVLLFSVNTVFGQAESELAKAVELYRQGAFDRAITALEGLGKIKNYNEAAMVQNYLGLAYLEKNELKKARKALEKAVALKPQTAVFKANLAFVLLRSNKLDNAREEAGKAIAIDPRLYTAYYVRGVAAFRERDFSEAVADADRAIAVNADFSPAYTLKHEAYLAEFGNRVASGSTPKKESELLKKAVEALETCVKNCKANAELQSQQEKLEAARVFHRFFTLEKDAAITALPGAVPTAPDPNQLKIISKPRASYTDAARQAGVSGTIKLAVLFDANGSVSQAIVLKPLGYGLDQEAVRAARGIRFTPAQKDGKSVPVVKMVEYTFTIY